MSDKEDVLRAIRKLPDDVSIADIVEELAMLQSIREGDKDIEAGRVMPHEEFKRQIEQWLSRSNGRTERDAKPVKSSA